jgi:ubiquinone/menaquinone biosynthesis C-methylase UbiE
MFWRRVGEEIGAGTTPRLDWYGWRARRLDAALQTVADTRVRAGKVLEIGSGPIGIVNFLKWGDRYAIDPLEHFYRTQPELVDLRRPGVTYMDGSGERLPFEDASVSLVLIENVIDHTHEPVAILKEIRRVLTSDGCLFLTVNVHTRWGAGLHAVLAVLRIDRRHPYTFTSDSLHVLLTATGFRVVSEAIDDYKASARADRRDPKLRAKVKGYTGLSEFVHSVICTKDHAFG